MPNIEPRGDRFLRKQKRKQIMAEHQSDSSESSPASDSEMLHSRSSSLHERASGFVQYPSANRRRAAGGESLAFIDRDNPDDDRDDDFCVARADRAASSHIRGKPRVSLLVKQTTRQRVFTNQQQQQQEQANKKQQRYVRKISRQQQQQQQRDCLPSPELAAGESRSESDAATTTITRRGNDWHECILEPAPSSSRIGGGGGRKSKQTRNRLRDGSKLFSFQGKCAVCVPAN